VLAVWDASQINYSGPVTIRVIVFGPDNPFTPENDPVLKEGRTVFNLQQADGHADRDADGDAHAHRHRHGHSHGHADAAADGNPARHGRADLATDRHRDGAGRGGADRDAHPNCDTGGDTDGGFAADGNALVSG
jgi:hypothetical protein